MKGGGGLSNADSPDKNVFERAEQIILYQVYLKMLVVP